MFYLYSGENLFFSQPPTVQQCIGPLPDVLSCEVERDTEGLFDLTLTYPLESYNGGNLMCGNWVRAPAGGTLGMQYFCIDSREVSADKIVTVHASHASYNANDILAAPFTAAGPDGISKTSDWVYFSPWQKKLLENISAIDGQQLGGFSVIGHTDGLRLNAAYYKEPVTLRQAVADAAMDRDVAVLSDGFNLKLWKVPENAAPSFTIRYGKDLLSYSNSAEADDFYTYIFPYAVSGEKYITYHGQIFQRRNIPAELAGIKKIRAVNLSGMYGLDELSGGIDLDILDICIDMWLKQHPFQAFPATVSVEAMPDQGNTYELGLAGDIYFGGQRTRASIVSLRYDALRDRVTEIGVGSIRRDISDTIAGLTKKRK